MNMRTTRMLRVLNTTVQTTCSLCNVSRMKWNQPEGEQTCLKIYNSVTQKKELFVIPKNRPLTWYMCGPTVYDHTHIGHVSSYLRLDVIRRIIEDVFRLPVITLLGITDIDDKIILRSKLKSMKFQDLTREFENDFFRDLSNFAIRKPNMTVRVTQSVPIIIDFIQTILDNDFAYITKNGSVYFDLHKYRHQYGQFNHNWMQLDNETGPEEGSEEKRYIYDFALWKAYKEGEPWWPSPWGHGRPGWHIECSAMARHVLGEQIDIHSGGRDLKFPHHENEIAQCNASFHQRQWVNYWIHTGHLCIKDSSEKMSKSLGNYTTVNDFLQQCTANIFRIYCLMKNYREDIEYDDTSITNARNTEKKIDNFIHRATTYVQGLNTISAAHHIDDTYIYRSIMECNEQFLSALSDDFNTPRAVSSLLDLMDRCNLALVDKPQEPGTARHTSSVAAVIRHLENSLGLLGVNSSSTTQARCDISNTLLDDVINKAVTFRRGIRQSALSLTANGTDVKTILQSCDEFRAALSSSGVKITDHRNESTWQLIRR